jgi:UDP-2,4-diacetamido-2,4,6-trideoxy-beta-L-altropyranose hydrolase
MAAAGASGRPVLMLDDDARHARYPVRAVLNQNLHARAEDYAGKTTATLMLGPRHALIRQDLRNWRHWKRHHPEAASKLLVTLGGADSGGHTQKVIQALGQLKHRSPEARIVARVVVGGANPQAGALRASASENPDVELLFDVRDMAAQIRWCDAALSASGSTVWELALF